MYTHFIEFLIIIGVIKCETIIKIICWSVNFQIFHPLAINFFSPLYILYSLEDFIHSFYFILNKNIVEIIQNIHETMQ